jgi:hypothetical protein
LRRQDDVSAFLASFAAIEAASTDAPRPAQLSVQCEGHAKVAQPMAPVSLVGATLSAADVQAQCGTSSTCIVPAGVTVFMDSSVHVGALVVRGTWRWDDALQPGADQWLCAGYCAVEAGGLFNLTVHDAGHRAYVFITDNGASHSVLGPRGFGGVGSANIEVSGRPLTRSWSLLAESAAASASTLTLLHDPLEMGWRVGDRIMLAPTARGSAGVADATTITALSGAPANAVTLGTPLASAYSARFSAAAGAVVGLTAAAEVLNLQRNVRTAATPTRMLSSASTPTRLLSCAAACSA